MGVWILTSMLTSCQETIVSDDHGMRLSFSQDSVCFDTVFTDMGSATKQVMVYNHNSNAIVIHQVRLQSDAFYINLDGENQVDNLHDIQLNGGDSLFLFIRVRINPNDENSPILVQDTVYFDVNNHTQALPLEAYGQNVVVMRSSQGRTDYTEPLTLTSEKPYLIYDTLVTHANLTIQAGATLYMHNQATIVAHQNVQAIGTLAQPITIQGDRLDRLFDSVPYRVASGQWVGIYLLSGATAGITYHLDYVDILSGNVGLYCQSEDPAMRAQLTLHNARIHNHAKYGIVLINTDAQIANSEISNCASYCLYLAGGEQEIVHSTIASYFGWPHSNLNIHTTSREDVPAVYINTRDYEQVLSHVTICNSIIDGVRSNNLEVDTLPAFHFTGALYNNYLRADSILFDWSHDNVYAQDSDSVFVNTHYMYKEYHYFDFRLDSLSPARGIGHSDGATAFPMDKNGHPRPSQRPDAGCYQWVEN